MTIKFVSKNPPNDRRVLALDPATVTTIAIKPGQILSEAASGYALRADGGSLLGGPVWAFTDSARKDVQSSTHISVVDGPFVADVNTDCYVGTPALNDALIVGTTSETGKLKVQAVSTVAHLQAVVAYCIRSADADGFIRVKVLR